MSYIVVDLPEPGPGQAWCQACAMFLKQAVNTAHRQRITGALADGKDDVVRIRPKHPAGSLQLAAVRGICAELQQFGMLDLCWYHLGGVALVPASSLVPGQLPPPGLIKGRG
jgi:hypothetical protein